MVLCHSMNAGGVMGTLRGGADTVIEFVKTFCIHRQ